FVKRAVGLLESLAAALPPPGAHGAEIREGSRRSLRERLGASLEELAGRVDDAIHGAGLAALSAAAAVAAQIHPRTGVAPEAHDQLLKHLEVFLERVRSRMRGLGGMGDRVRRMWHLTEITAACVVGALRDGVLTGGFSAVDG